jgi:HEAT repeat protein
MRFRNKSTLPIFADIAENDSILRLRQRATLALGLLQSDKAISHLVKLSSDKLPEIRGAAALGMAATQSKKNDFSEIMKEMMAESDPYVKIRAEAGWNAIKKKTVVLREQLKSQDSDLRQFAALYFRNQGQSADLNVLKDAWNSEADEDVRFELSAAIESTKKRVAQAKKAAAAKAAAKKNPPAAKTTSQTVN